MIACTKTKGKSAELTEKDGDSKEFDSSADDCTCLCSSGDGTDSPTGDFYFVESDIDKEYTEHCEEMSQYQPFHCLVRCPCVLESFASLREHSCQPSLKQHVSKMFKQSQNRPVKPVYRSHSLRAIPALNNCNLCGSDFTRGHFANSSLKECDLTGCTILFGELSKVDCSGSCLKETYFSHCNLAGMVARDCEWTKATVLYSCADEAELISGKNPVGAGNWTGTSLENAITADSPSASTSAKQGKRTEDVDERIEERIYTDQGPSAQTNKSVNAENNPSNHMQHRNAIQLAQRSACDGRPPNAMTYV